MKKISYTTKTHTELETELKSLRAELATVLKSRTGKSTKAYGVVRKNIARVLTALSALPAVITSTTKGEVNSTEVEK